MRKKYLCKYKFYQSEKKTKKKLYQMMNLRKKEKKTDESHNELYDVVYFSKT